MKVDYIIVGLGLAGLCFAERVRQAGKSFVLYEDGSQKASKVAAGVYNPVILKRFTQVWDATDQLAIALPFYHQLAKTLNITIDRPLDIIRPFASIEEQNDWFAAADKPFFEKYMSDEVLQLSNPFLQASFGYGRLTHTGLIQTSDLISGYREFLNGLDRIRQERFDYADLYISENGVIYQSYHANRIVFCEGYGVVENPFFKTIPLKEAKGELLVIHAPELKLDYLLKAGVFVLPLGNDQYKIGATFNWTDKSQTPSENGKKELMQKFEKICSVPYTIVDQLAAIRPTVVDRRPILGNHPKHSRLTLLNGLGTRGVMLAPKMSQLLFNYLEHDRVLPEDIQLSRFKRHRR